MDKFWPISYELCLQLRVDSGRYLKDNWISRIDHRDFVRIYLWLLIIQ